MPRSYRRTFRIGQSRDIHAALTIFEKDLNKIKIGQSVNISLPNLVGKSYPAKIILISRTLDENRAAMVHCHFEKEDHSLTPGIFLNAAIEVAETNALSVPNEAILRFENRFFVFISKNENHFELVEIKQGVADKDFTQINAVEAGIDLSNQNIVVKNAYTLLGKMKNTEEE
jgi:membrane fusion protein, heavy metal efflux system